MSVKCIPLIPNFYTVKLGYTWVYMYLFFLILIQNIDCGYFFEQPRRGSSNVHPQSMFLANIRKILKTSTNQRTIGPENAHLKPDLGVLSHNEMTLTLNTHTPLLTP